MRNPNPVTIKRIDYLPPNWTVPETRLLFELHPMNTRVSSTLSLRQSGEGPLVLDGVDMRLESIAVDGVPLDKQNYVLGDDQLIIENMPSICTLSIVTVINPESNTALEGLYRSSGNFCTQCEAQGFRKITYYPDRPDVLSVFHVSIIADANDYPVLLSNGNVESTQQLDNGKHRVNWFDPYPKPCYLFALVAGDLAHITEPYTTGSGRHVDLFIYVEAHNLDQCQYAMDALKRSMRWDEQVYGLEYDLDCFMIVAVDDFNMGAMENKGLNVFNSKYVLANENTATDADFLGVESVIAHEYFHNWTGNRVTCRDWFQLSLKEGLTVFRDQQFSADMHSKTVKRIEEVRLLKARQFPEDAGPTAHPIRPDSFIEINNFYTLTVYEKGAEVIRMIHTLLGADAFRSGMDMYFNRHDGQAVTCDDFIDAMQDASGVVLSQFRRWYEQAGTPVLSVHGVHDDKNKTYTLHVHQQSPDTPGQFNKLPLHIPFKVGLLSLKGQSLPLSTGRADGDSVVLDVTESTQQFVFENIDGPPVASFLRGYSAPVILEYEASEESLAFQLTHDTDNFNRWESGQQLATLVVTETMESAGVPSSLAVLEGALGTVLLDGTLEPAFKAEILLLPSIDTLASSQSVIDIAAIHHARTAVVKSIAHTYQDIFVELVRQSRLSSGCHTAGDRRLANVALTLLTELDSEHWVDQASEQYWQARNMTDRVAAATALCCAPGEQRDGCLSDFYENWQQHKLVIDKWFSIQATASHDTVLHDIDRLRNLSSFDIGNPNRVRALIGAFANANPVQLHTVGGEGYRLVEEFICLLDQSNPQLAARLVTPFLQWQRHCEPQRQLMHDTLQNIAVRDDLSPDVFEMVSKALAR